MNDQRSITVNDLILVEQKIAELEHSNAVISQELYLANNKILALENKLELFSRAIKELKSLSDFGETPIDRPPHY